jgi:putative FmdB family regulatory protein
MPLYNYQCKSCNIVVEKFMHRGVDKVDITCECGNKEFTKLFGNINSRTYLNSKDLLNNKINPDIERIRRNINKGKDKDFLDIYGDK